MPDRTMSVLDLFKGGEALRVEQISQLIGVSKENAYRYLMKLIDLGKIERVQLKLKHRGSGGHTAYLYKLKGAVAQPEVKAGRTPPAYRNLRLTENLQGYDHGLRDFAALCMMVRRCG